MARRVENQLLLHQLYRTCNGDLPDIFKKKKMQGKCNERKIPPPIISKKRTNNQKKQKQNKFLMSVTNSGSASFSIFLKLPLIFRAEVLIFPRCFFNKVHS